MKRRTYLGTLAAVTLAGCTGSRAGGDPTPSDTTEDRDTTERSTTEHTSTERTTNGGVEFPYDVGVSGTADAPVADATMDATVTRNFASDHPARLRVSFRNDASDAREFAFGSLVPWDTIAGRHEDGDASLLLAPTESVVPDEPTDDCWQATDGVALPAVMRTETVDPGETVSATFHLLAAHDSDDCHPPGTYRFADENYLENGWWFDVDVVPIVAN